MVKEVVEEKEKIEEKKELIVTESTEKSSNEKKKIGTKILDKLKSFKSKFKEFEGVNST